MATPYRQLASPTRDLAAAAALPPDAYLPRGRWATVGRNLGWVIALLGAAEVAHIAVGSSVLTLGFFVVAYAVLFGQVIRRRRMALRLVRENDEAVAQLNGADLDSAVRRLDALAVQSRGLGFYHAQVVFNRGVAFIRQGQPEHALALFDAVARSGWFERFRALGFDALLASGQSIPPALLDDVPAAEGFLAPAQAPVPAAPRGQVPMAETVLGPRKGRARPRPCPGAGPVCVDRHGLPFADDDFHEHSRRGRRNFGVHLVGGDLENGLITLHAIAHLLEPCLLKPSDAADEESGVNTGWRRFSKKKKNNNRYIASTKE